AFGRELEYAQQLTVGEERKLDGTLGCGWFLRGWNRLTQPDLREVPPLSFQDPVALAVQGPLHFRGKGGRGSLFEGLELDRVWPLPGNGRRDEQPERNGQSHLHWSVVV